MSLTLYGFNGSTYVRTVKMLLAEKKADFDQVPVNVMKGEPLMPEHLARHPFGKVPVVDHDGFRIIESSAVNAYLNEVLPGPDLMPDNARDRARAHMAISIYDSYGYGALVQVFGYHLFPDFLGGQNAANHSKGIEDSKKVLGHLMKIKGDDPFIAGDSPTLADFYLAPAIAYLSMTPDAAELLKVPGLAEWWERIQALDSFKSTPPQ